MRDYKVDVPQDDGVLNWWFLCVLSVSQCSLR